MQGLRLRHHSLTKPFWTHLMVLLGEEVQVEAWFGLFGDTANLDARQVHGLHRPYHMLSY